jgi:hypothetical protein
VIVVTEVVVLMAIVLVEVYATQRCVTRIKVVVLEVEP